MKVTLDEFQDRMQRMAKDVTSAGAMHDVMKHIGAAVRKDCIDSFGDESSPDKTWPEKKGGEGWEPLAASTQRRKAAAGTTDMLVQSGLMKRRISYRRYREGKSSGVSIGTKARSDDGAPYPVYVQGGTRNMPARPFIGFNDNTAKEILKHMKDAIAAGKL